MSADRPPSGRTRLEQVIRLAQDSLSTFAAAEAGRAVLIFEILRRDGRSQWMQAFVHPDVLPENEEEVTKAIKLLNKNTEPLKIFENPSEQEAAFYQIRKRAGLCKKAGLSKQRDFLDSLRREYEENIRIPLRLAATTLIYRAWHAYNFNSKWYRSPAEGVKAPELEQALLTEVSEEGMTSQLMEMASHLGFLVESNEDEVLLYTEPGIAPIRWDLPQEDVEQLSPEDRRLLWIEYSLIHRLQYDAVSEPLLLAHYPLIADGFWFMGFAYRLARPRGDVDLPQARELDDLFRKSVIDPFASLNLKEALVTLWLEELVKSRSKELKVREEAWPTARLNLLKSAVNELMPFLDWQSRPTGEDLLGSLGFPPPEKRPHWLVDDLVQKVDAQVKWVRAQIDQQRFQLQAAQITLFDRTFRMLKHDLAGIGSKTFVKEDPGIEATIFITRCIAGAVHELAFPTVQLKTEKWKEVRRHLRILMPEVIERYDGDRLPDHLELSMARVRLLYSVFENGQRHEDWSVEGQLVYLEESGKLHINHIKRLTGYDAAGVAQWLDKLNRGDSEAFGKGVPLIATTVESLGGDAHWIFSAGGDVTVPYLAARSEVEKITSPTGAWDLKAPQYLLDTEVDIAVLEEIDVQWKLTIDVPLGN